MSHIMGSFEDTNRTASWEEKKYYFLKTKVLEEGS